MREQACDYARTRGVWELVHAGGTNSKSLYSFKSCYDPENKPFLPSNSVIQTVSSESCEGTYGDDVPCIPEQVTTPNLEPIGTLRQYANYLTTASSVYNYQITEYRFPNDLENPNADFCRVEVDYCKSDDLVVEAMCSGNALDRRTFSCSQIVGENYVCSRGRCVPKGITGGGGSLDPSEDSSLCPECPPCPECPTTDPRVLECVEYISVALSGS